MRLRHAFCLVIAACLGACSSKPGEAVFSDYEARLGRTLDVSFSATDPAEAARKPRAEALQLDLQGSDIGTLNFLALTGCELQITIGKRNSSLGKLAAPSQRLLLDLEFLRYAPACIEHLAAQPEQRELVALLERSQRLKQQQLAQHIFNATLAGPEWHQFWRHQDIPTGYPKHTTSDQVLQALDAITAMASRWLEGNYAADNAAFEAHLNTLRSGDGGVILTAAQLGQQFLARWNTSLGEYAQQRGCTPLPNHTKTILETVIAKYFVGGVQQWLAPIMSRAENIQGASNNLEQLLRTASPIDYSLWQQQRDNDIQALKLLTKDHVHRLKSVLEPCRS